MLATIRSHIKIPILRLLLFGKFDVNRAYSIVSTPRSGSTWLGNILSTISGSCVLFEPLHLNQVPQSKHAGFTWRTWVPPREYWPEGKAFLKDVFEGKVLNSWTTREINIYQAIYARILIVKFVRATRLLPWICENFEIPPPVLLIRHPCAVIASQLKSAYWCNSGHPGYPEFIRSFPAFMKLLERLKTVEEYLAAAWALDNLPPLLAEMPNPWQLVTYEELYLNTEEPVRRIFQNWGIDADIKSAISKSRADSSSTYSTGKSGLDGWRKQLSSEQISRILNVISAFGLSFYDKSLEPDLSFLLSNDRPSLIAISGNA